MDKIYKVRISFGDGNPVEDSIVARSGVLAQDIAMSRHPGARNVHLIGVDNRHENYKPIPAPAPVVETPQLKWGEIPLEGMEEWNRDTQVKYCLHLYKQGKSQRMIAGHLQVSRSTVARWIKQYS